MPETYSSAVPRSRVAPAGARLSRTVAGSCRYPGPIRALIGENPVTMPPEWKGIDPALLMDWRRGTGGAPFRA